MSKVWYGWLAQSKNIQPQIRFLFVVKPLFPESLFHKSKALLNLQINWLARLILISKSLLHRKFTALNRSFLDL